MNKRILSHDKGSNQQETRNCLIGKNSMKLFGTKGSGNEEHNACWYNQ
jgi:hypothetical protein